MQSLQEVGLNVGRCSLALGELINAHGREYRIGDGLPTSEPHELA